MPYVCFHVRVRVRVRVRASRYALVDPGWSGTIFLNDHSDPVVYNLFKGDLGCVLMPLAYIAAPEVLESMLQRGVVQSFAAGLQEGPVKVKSAVKSNFLSKVACTVLTAAIPQQSPSGIAIRRVDVSKCARICQQLELHTKRTLANKDSVPFAVQQLERKWHVDGAYSIVLDCSIDLFPASNAKAVSEGGGRSGGSGTKRRSGDGTTLSKTGVGTDYGGDLDINTVSSRSILETITLLTAALNHLVCNTDGLADLGRPVIYPRDVLDAWEHVQQKNEGQQRGYNDAGTTPMSSSSSSSKEDGGMSKLAAELDALMGGDGFGTGNGDTPGGGGGRGEDAGAKRSGDGGVSGVESGKTLSLEQQTDQWFKSNSNSSGTSKTGSKGGGSNTPAAPPLSVVQPGEMLKVLEPLMQRQQRSQSMKLLPPSKLRRTCVAPVDDDTPTGNHFDLDARTNQLSHAVGEAWAYLYLLDHLPKDVFGTRNWTALQSQFTPSLEIKGQ